MSPCPPRSPPPTLAPRHYPATVLPSGTVPHRCLYAGEVRNFCSWVLGRSTLQMQYPLVVYGAPLHFACDSGSRISCPTSRRLGFFNPGLSSRILFNTLLS